MNYKTYKYIMKLLKEHYIRENKFIKWLEEMVDGHMVYKGDDVMWRIIEVVFNCIPRGYQIWNDITWYMYDNDWGNNEYEITWYKAWEPEKWKINSEDALWNYFVQVYWLDKFNRIAEPSDDTDRDNMIQDQLAKNEAIVESEEARKQMSEEELVDMFYKMLWS